MASNEHTEGSGHGHTHGSVDPSIAVTKKGLWAGKWSFIGLMATFLFQVIIVAFTGSVALLADTIHNLGDAVTAIPLGIAFLLGLKKPSKRFTYGLGRVEDLAGVIVVLLILTSAIVAGYEAIDRILHPREITNVWAVILSSIIGFIGNEAVAIFRIKVGKEMGSAALIADGYHARIDGFTSLAVLIGAIGVFAGFPLADPVIGLLITVTIAKIVWDSMRKVFVRLLDGVEPEFYEKIEHALAHVSEIRKVSNIRARWSGHSLLVEVFVQADPSLSFTESHGIVGKIEDTVMSHIPYVGSVMVRY
jgi:cation diffusion facilitator family transporter